MKKCNVYYLLSEEGRKKSLLSGGNGKKLQVIEADLTEVLLEKANVDDDGNVTVSFGMENYRRDDSWTNEIVTDLNILEPKISKYYKKFGFTASNGKIYYTEYNHENLVMFEIEKGSIKEVKKVVHFDEPMSVDVLIKWDNERIETLKNKEKMLKEELDRLYKEKEIELENMKCIIEEENEKRKNSFINRIENKIKEDKERERKSEMYKKEKAAWINKNGSEKLKKAYKLGYDCQRSYVLERSGIEFPEYIVDFNNTAHFKERVNPSLEALEEVEELLDKGYDAEIVWLTDKPTNDVNDDDEDYYDNYFNPREAIRIKNYLGGYDLYKFE